MTSKGQVERRRQRNENFRDWYLQHIADGIREILDRNPVMRERYNRFIHPTQEKPHDQK